MKNVQIRTYRNPKEINIDALNKNNKVLHICATPSLTQAMINNSNIKETNGANIISVKWFIDAILGEWMDLNTKLSQMVSLSELVRKGSPKNTEDKNITKSIRKNKADALLTIRMLAELDISPQQFKKIGKNKYEKELSDIWSELYKDENNHLIFQKLKNTMNKLKDPSLTIEYINNKLWERYDIEEKNLKVRKEALNLNHLVILHGFYFISPIQQEIFKALEKANVKIIFLQFYDGKHPEIFSFLTETLGTSNGWVNHRNWKPMGNVLPSNRAMFYANKYKKSKDKISVEHSGIYINEYNDFNDLLENIKKNNKDNDVNLSVISDQMNEKVKEYYSDLFKSEKNFLSYPLGQYLNHLHKIWHQEMKKEKISVLILQESFTSPWLIYRDSNGNDIKATDYQHILEAIKEFFPYFMEFDELKNAINKLINDIEDSPFINRSKITEDRFFDEIINPIKKVGPYNINSKDLVIVLSFIERIQEHKNLLFNKDNQYLSFKNYFTLLQSLIKNNLSYDDLNKEEKELINKVGKIAQSYQKSIITGEYHIENFAESIQLILVSKLENENEKELTKIRSFEEIDGEIFNNNSIHLSGLDEFSFPDIKTSLPWPLSLNTVEELEEVNISFKSMSLREQHKRNLPRYLFYLLLSSNQKLTLSWLTNWNGNSSLKQSNYLKLIEDISEKTFNDPFSFELPVIESINIKFNGKLTETKLNEFPEFALSELNICNRRFYYSYITQKYSSFKSDFHLGFLFSNVYSLLERFQENPDEQIDEVFPYWSKTKKEIKIANIKNYPDQLDNMSFSYKGINYKANSSTKYLIRQNSSHNQWQSAWNNHGYVINDEINLLDANPSANCKYCPHEYFCSDARYSIDDERYK